MEKWSFNKPLFSGLSRVLDISGAEIARRCGMAQQVLNRYMNNEKELSVRTLMDICNALRMPIHYFVSENGNFVTPDREDATLPPDVWQPVTWDCNAVELTFGDGNGRIYWKDVAVAMRVSAQKPHERFLLRTRFPVSDLFRVCNQFNISPFKFIVDPNRGVTDRHNRKRSVSSHDSQSEIELLRKQVISLSAKVDTLTNKFAALLEAHKKLSSIVHANIESDRNRLGNTGTDDPEN